MTVNLLVATNLIRPLIFPKFQILFYPLVTTGSAYSIFVSDVVLHSFSHSTLDTDALFDVG